MNGDIKGRPEVTT